MRNYIVALICVMLATCFTVVGETYQTDLVTGMNSITTTYDDQPALGLAAAKGGGFSGGARGGSFSSGGARSSSSSFGSRSVSSSSPSMSRSSVYGSVPSTGSKSAVFGTSKPLSVSSTNGKNVIAGSYKTKPYVAGTNKITTSTPKTYFPNKYKYHGREYNHVYYGSGFDFNSLLLMGFILSHDDNGNPVYINEATGEVVTKEDVEPVEEGPGFESIFAITGLLAVAYLVLGRRD